MKRINNLAILMLIVSLNVSAQEIFFTHDGQLYNQTPSHFYLYSQGVYNDYITQSPDKALQVSGSTYVSLSRFYENSTIGLQSSTGYLQIPSSVISESTTTTDKGFTISGWIKINSINNVSLGFWGTSYSGITGVKADVAIVNRRIIIRKKTRLKDNTISPIIVTDFTIDYDNSVPTTGDLTNGYLYFSIASDNQTCRVTVSRPGGRLYTRLYYVSLSDVITSDDSFFWGRSPISPNSTMDIPYSFDDIMVYNSYLTAEDNLNAFYLQAPLCPGVSYLFKSPDGYTAAPENNGNETQVFNNDYYKWFNTLNYTGDFSCNKWFVKHSAKTAISAFPMVYFANARSGGNIYQQTSSNYVYQLLEPSDNYPYRTKYLEERNVIPQNMYTPTPDNVGTVYFHSRNSTDYSLGWDGTYMYLVYPNQINSWRIAGANKVYDKGSESKFNMTDVTKKYVMIRNYGLNKYLDIYFGGTYYYSILSERDLNNNNQKYTIYPASTSEDGIYKKFRIKTYSGNFISAYWGETDNTENENIIAHPQAFAWELVYVKDDANNKPLYAIRANNERGSFLLGYKTVMGTNPYYVCQASAGAYTSMGSVSDNFLWSFEVHAGPNI